MDSTTFAQKQASRPKFDLKKPIEYTQPPSPETNNNNNKNHIEINPYEPGRQPFQNYKLLISSIVPRPIALISTISKDRQTTNLAPFSYFQVLSHDPPLFSVSFVGSIAEADKKDTLRNLLDTNECVINIVSEHFLEAANATSVNAPYGISEFGIAGLTQVAITDYHPSAASSGSADNTAATTAQPPRVQESIFSIHGKLLQIQEFESRVNPGKVTSVLAIIEGTRFWVREDAINEDKSEVDLEVLRPISRLGGIRYGRTTEVVELERPKF